MDGQNINVPGRWIRAMPVVTLGNRPTKVIMSVMCCRVIWARPVDCHQHKRPRRRKQWTRTTKSAESAADTVAQTVQVVSTSPMPVHTSGSGRCRGCHQSQTKPLIQYLQTVGQCQLITPVRSCCKSRHRIHLLWLPFYAKKDYDLSRRGTTNGANIRCPAETLIPLVFYPNYRLYVSLVLM